MFEIYPDQGSGSGSAPELSKNNDIVQCAAPMFETDPDPDSGSFLKFKPLFQHTQTF